MPSLVKELMIKEIQGEFESNPYAFISSFEGLSVADFSDFRRTLEKVAKRSLVIKHSLAKKVFEERQLQGADKLLKGSVCVTFGAKEPQVISKAIIDFAKTHEKLVPSGVIFENQVFGQEYVKSLAKLPSRRELLTQVAVRMKSPISGFVMTLNQLIRGVVVALNEVKKQREAAPQPA